jgi:hypothetical protein
MGSNPQTSNMCIISKLIMYYLYVSTITEFSNYLIFVFIKNFIGFNFRVSKYVMRYRYNPWMSSNHKHFKLWFYFAVLKFHENTFIYVRGMHPYNWRLFKIILRMCLCITYLHLMFFWLSIAPSIFVEKIRWMLYYIIHQLKAGLNRKSTSSNLLELRRR